ncbi:methyltransferase, TIGR04325 family [Solirhodobacter olei]|uniref:methyltransferase, TIGR04325 family n=1 Tax=Solirhodobacter olei TaxID=2493082 RepID=UPI000FDA1ED8|nr:methyltransferase, TIGR04325 family [Solirhodobacter olei]
MREFIKSLFQLTPVTADAWRYWRVYPNNIAACRGVYRTWQEAKAGAQTAHRIRTKTDILTFSAPKGVQIHSLSERDYPILVHMRPILRPGVRILNIGGSLAKEYGSYRELIPFPADFNWRICEVPAVVAAGQEMLQNGNYPGLSFTSEMKGEADIFLICGALQYLEPSLPALLSQLDLLPEHVFISRTPMQSGADTFYTVQNIGSDAVPYRIENEDAFIRSMTAIGYRLVDAWRDRRKMPIPFFHEGDVNGYLGFYFHLDDAAGGQARSA